MTESNSLPEPIQDAVAALLAAPDALGPLDRKIVAHFPGLVVRKDLTKGLKQNAVVPTYVLEYLLGQHCATDDPVALKSGLEAVQRILATHYVHRNQAELVKSTIKEKGRHKIIDKLTVELNEKGGFYEAEFTNLGLRKVPVGDDFVRRHPKLLVGGIWCITDVRYALAEDPKASPWQIETLKPIQVSRVDYDEYVKARAAFSTEEWLGVLMQSIGFNPDQFSRRGKLLQLLRLVPYCERNYNLLELGPKGTGKSHVYAEFSPHGILISGSEVTTPKLFVNNATGKIGLVGYWDLVCFDEFAGKDKRVDKALVDIMKNYMANRSFSRGIEQLTAEASMVFMGNTKKSVAWMLKHSHFYEQLPDKYIDSAFLDRMHAFSPGWEVAPIRNELFSGGYGFIVDYIAEVLKQQRNEDYTGAYKAHFELASEVSTRDQTGLEKTFSGMMKILYPDGSATPAEIEELLALGMELRRRVREHILRIDDTFSRHDFVYRRLADGTLVTVITPEERQYPVFAAPRLTLSLITDPDPGEEAGETAPEAPPAPQRPAGPPAQHIVIPENTKGWSYARLFADYLRGAGRVVVRDPYVRKGFQTRNLMEFLALAHSLVGEGDEMAVHLVTQSDDDITSRQDEVLNQMAENFGGSRIAFTWEFDESPGFHARSIVTDTGWKIVLDRGLDLWQKYEGGTYALEQAVQEARLARGGEVTYVREG